MPTYGESNVESVVQKYGTSLFRISFAMLQNRQDAEDAVQEVFLRYLAKAPSFTEAEHEKAWLIRVTRNHCLNLRLFKARHRHVNLQDYTDLGLSDDQAEILDFVRQLPMKYQIVLQLYYMEGYRGAEIAILLGISPATARKRLQKGRELLKMEYERED